MNTSLSVQNEVFRIISDAVEVAGGEDDLLPAAEELISRGEPHVVVSATPTANGSQGAILDDSALALWEQRGSLGEQPAIIRSVRQEDVAGNAALEITLEGISKEAQVFRDFPYDGSSPISFSVQMQVVQHEPLGGAYIYVRGYNEDGLERLRMIYTLYENLDTPTSGPSEDQAFFSLKIPLSQPNLGDWTEVSQDVAADFNEVFPGVWNTLELQHIRLELSAWSDAVVTAKFANPDLIIGGRHQMHVGVQNITEPEGMPLLTTNDTTVLLSGTNTFLITPSVEQRIRALYKATASRLTEGWRVGQIRYGTDSEGAVLAILTLLASDNQETPLPVLVSEHSVTHNNLPNALRSLIEASVDVIDLGNVEITAALRIVQVAEEMGFDGLFLVASLESIQDLQGRLESLGVNGRILLPGLPTDPSGLPEPLQELVVSYGERFGGSPDLRDIYPREIIIPAITAAFQRTDLSFVENQLTTALQGIEWETTLGLAYFEASKSAGGAWQVVVPIPVVLVGSDLVEFLGVY